MSTKYSTIQQHEPLRVPANWGKQERFFISQLEEVLDDVYRRFGRLRLEDMGKDFQNTISDIDGNISSIQQDISTIQLSVRDKYDKVSGISITSAGIDITGSQYVKIAAGSSTYWKYDSSGLIYYAANGSPMLQFSDYAKKVSNIVAGVYCEKNNYGGVLHLYVANTSGASPKDIVLDYSGSVTNWIEKADGTREYYTSTMPVLRPSTSYVAAALGSSTYPWESLTVHQVSAQSVAASSLYINGRVEFAGSTSIFTCYGTSTFLGDVTFARALNISSTLRCLSLDCTGSLSAASATIYDAYITILHQGSSRDVKHNIRPMEDMGSVLDRLAPVRYAYNSDESERDRFGLIYEDTIQVLPEICYETETGKALCYTDLISVLINEVKSLRHRMSKLEKRSAAA